MAARPHSRAIYCGGKGAPQWIRSKPGTRQTGQKKNGTRINSKILGPFFACSNADQSRAQNIAPGFSFTTAISSVWRALVRPSLLLIMPSSCSIESTQS